MAAHTDPPPGDSPDDTPWCSQEEFDNTLKSIVADHAPRVFAVWQVYRERIDGRIAGWGLAFEDHAFLVSTDRSLRMSLNRPEDALMGFHRGDDVRARVVWYDPAAVTVDEED
ncbi:hypothetical protein [Saccharomonospora iraqiensis]|uniref:hypothetical protein n=1 Tax=Saccharomonospora iraqiensis TaxID=52698 RepID=UPI00022E7567|nr:hypothetical protein [Saccharomonospora iraqiensis]